MNKTESYYHFRHSVWRNPSETPALSRRSSSTSLDRGTKLLLGDYIPKIRNLELPNKQANERIIYTPITGLHLTLVGPQIVPSSIEGSSYLCCSITVVWLLYITNEDCFWFDANCFVLVKFCLRSAKKSNKSIEHSRFRQILSTKLNWFAEPAELRKKDLLGAFEVANRSKFTHVSRLCRYVSKFNPTLTDVANEDIGRIKRYLKCYLMNLRLVVVWPLW